MARIVRKFPIPVEMALSGQPSTFGVFFLSSRGMNGSGPDTLLGVMNRSDERMVPFERERDGAILLVSRRRIEWIRSVSENNISLMRSPGDHETREELMRVRFIGGTEIEGLVSLELHESTYRASDFMNGRDSFFTLLTPSGLCLVNKESVLEVRVFEGSPLPSPPENANIR